MKPLMMLMVMFSALDGNETPKPEVRVVTPLQALVEKGRASLTAAGLERKERDGSVYWIGGNSKAPVLVLLHGVNDQAGTWSDVVPLLKDDYRLIIPDLAGHGESEPRSGPISYSDILERLAKLIEAEAPETKVTITGNSMGGWMATLYALDHPDRVERLVLEDASGMAWLLSVPLAPTTREDTAKLMRAVHGPEANFPDEVLDAFMAQKKTSLSRISMQDAVAHLVDKRLPELKMPVTLIWGRNDGVLPLAYAEALQKKIPGSALTVIEGAAHIPHRQQPKRFVQCLKATC